MRLIKAVGFILAASVWTPAMAQSFVGEWVATAHTANGDVPETLSVTKSGNGYAIRAKLVSARPGLPEAGPGTDVVLDGDKFSYSRKIDFPGGGLTITYSGVVSGDTFTGTADLGGAKTPYTGVRAK